MQYWQILLALTAGLRSLTTATTIRTCTTGCKSMIIDDQDTNAMFEVTCIDGTYCVNEVAGAAACVQEPPDGCEADGPDPGTGTGTPIEPLVCTGEGIYPDPSDCSVFHYCPGYGSQSESQSCATGTVFDPEFQSSSPCKTTNDTEADCLQVDCTETTVFKRYGTSTKYFAYCRAAADSTEAEPKWIVSVFKCAAQTSFDGTQCAYQCVEEGNFANPASTTSYYQCYYSDGVLIGRTLACTNGRVFNDLLKICL
ncbi:uncharacterized protein LOC134222569 [Armigeres subalbatus]|uniref:uncharacterized protein LOC134222569 n=1 Tax=Armigeres subalbatus TaxID=124917 RepID=UPI002ED380B0